MRHQYGLAAKITHWGFIALFAYGIITQVDNIDQLNDAGFLRNEYIFATVFLATLAIRFAYMTLTQKTALPDDTANWQKIAAKAVHRGMYVALAGIPLTGFIIGLLFQLGVDGGGLLMLAALEFHGFTVLASYLLIGIHILAALYHRILGDGVWSAMTPFWQEK